jgi:predicted component of type VI protein secretion system
MFHFRKIYTAWFNEEGSIAMCLLILIYYYDRHKSDILFYSSISYASIRVFFL